MLRPHDTTRLERDSLNKAWCGRSRNVLVLFVFEGRLLLGKGG